MSGFGFPKALQSAGLVGDPTYFSTDPSLETDPNAEKTLLSITVPTGEIYSLSRIFVDCSVDGLLTMFADSSFIGSTTNRPGEKNNFFSWNPPRPIAAGVVIEVKFKQRDPDKGAASIRAHLMAARQFA